MTRPVPEWYHDLANEAHVCPIDLVVGGQRYRVEACIPDASWNETPNLEGLKYARLVAALQTVIQYPMEDLLPR